MEETARMIWSDIETVMGGLLGYSPRCGVETETSGSASDYGHLLGQGEDGREVLELDICFG